jgi:hypothetical protein
MYSLLERLQFGHNIFSWINEVNGTFISYNTSQNMFNFNSFVTINNFFVIKIEVAWFYIFVQNKCHNFNMIPMLLMRNCNFPLLPSCLFFHHLLTRLFINLFFHVNLIMFALMSTNLHLFENLFLLVLLDNLLMWMSLHTHLCLCALLFEETSYL